MIYLYNSLTQTKEKFVPLNDKKVKMYVCGITPYETTHLGHAFTYVWFDVLVRYLIYKGYKVVYTQNVTDIDDDILRKAKEENRDWKELGDFWTKKYLNDIKSLNVLPSTHYVKATDSISSMVQIIKLLLKKNYVYQRNGNVYFEIRKFKEYGSLSKLNRNQMTIISRERGGNPDDPLKKDPLDFLLWQRSQPKADPPLAEKTDEPFWDSPWGKGRPGWHIECSAMIKRYLGDRIDIHGGGRDLIFPHHESEIAQSESFTGKKPFVKFWVHTAMVLYQGEKMAKSLGNLIMVSELLKHNTANEIRWLLLSHHYRKPWEFEENELQQVKEDFAVILSAIKGEKVTEKINSSYMQEFCSLMDSDLGTPQEQDTLLRLAKRITRKDKNLDKIEMQQTLLKCLLILGFKF